MYWEQIIRNYYYMVVVYRFHKHFEILRDKFKKICEGRLYIENENIFMTDIQKT